MNIKKLFLQFVKFGIVGVICFFIDFGVYTLLANVLNVHYLIAGFLGFAISVIVNYLLSMKFVFKRREDMSRRREFIIYIILSVLGLGLNELILFICIDLIYFGNEGLQSSISEGIMNVIAKILATAIVMIYNFVTRKIFLEQKETTPDTSQKQ